MGYQKSPDTFPSSSTSILYAAGCFGSPGIVIMSPVRATINPAPADRRTSRTVSVKPFGLPSFAGRPTENTAFSQHKSGACLCRAFQFRKLLFRIRGEYNISGAVNLLCKNIQLFLYRKLFVIYGLKVSFFCLNRFNDLFGKLLSAFSAAGKYLRKRNRDVFFLAKASIVSISASVSVAKRFIATTTGKPYFLMFSI